MGKFNSIEKGHPVTISQQEDKSIHRKVFDIYFGMMSEKGNRDWGTYSLRGFNEDNYLEKFVKNFKGQETSCWLLFYTYIGYSETSLIRKENIKQVLSYSPDTLTLSPSLIPVNKPKNWFRKIFFRDGRPPFPFYAINFNENCFSNLRWIFDHIDSDTITECYFIIGRLTDKDILFSKLEGLYKENNLNKQGMYSISQEFIKLGLGCCGSDDTFQIVTNRFGLNEIKDIFLTSVNPERFSIFTRQ